MTQNTSHAVMAQRVEAHDSLDDFPTQPWATRALVEHVLIPRFGGLKGQMAWEPACNRGHMAKPLGDYFHSVHTSDIHNYGWPGQDAVTDFLWESSHHDLDAIDWIITNPPFRLAEQFIRKAGKVATTGSAFIVRTSFLESVGRYNDLFRDNPPAIIAQFVERVPMVKGRLTATGSTATSYCWLVWSDAWQKREFTWIPPCRRKLERPGDYTSEMTSPNQQGEA